MFGYKFARCHRYNDDFESDIDIDLMSDTDDVDCGCMDD